jgi:hypothetical protein
MRATSAGSPRWAINSCRASAIASCDRKTSNKLSQASNKNSSLCDKIMLAISGSALTSGAVKSLAGCCCCPFAAAACPHSCHWHYIFGFFFQHGFYTHLEGKMSPDATGCVQRRREVARISRGLPRKGPLAQCNCILGIISLSVAQSKRHHQSACDCPIRHIV